MVKRVLVIARKEIVDHTREGRAVSAALLHLLIGPLVVLLVSFSSAMKANAKGVQTLTGMMSIFVLVAAFAGGMNVAMDVVAGERERRSLLPLLLNPVSRLAVVTGKWVATSVFSVGGLAVTVLAFQLVDSVSGFANPLFSKAALLCWIGLGLMPLAMFAAALQVAISTVCRTAKEAHTYLSMLIFAPMGAAMFVLFFPQRLGPWSAFVPIAGHQSMAMAALQSGHWSLPRASTLGLVTAGLAVAAVFGAGKLLERDSVVYGS